MLMGMKQRQQKQTKVCAHIILTTRPHSLAMQPQQLPIPNSQVQIPVTSKWPWPS